MARTDDNTDETTTAAEIAQLRAAVASAKASADAAKASADAAAAQLAKYEDLEQSQLHVQAVAVSNIKTMIPLELHQASPHYNRWRLLFLNTLSKYGLDTLVLSDADVSTDTHWHRMDCTVKSWLYSTVSSDLIEAVSTSAPTSRSFGWALKNNSSAR